MPGSGDFAEVETRVLDRMEQLRAHQLKHPEAVTEGMNRLAQALVCLTDPVARAAYDRQLGIAPPPFEVVEDESLEAPLGPARGQRVRQQDLPYEVVEPDAAPLFEIVPVDELLGAPAPVLENAPPTAGRAPTRPPKLKRRTIYRRLAALRRAIRAWEALRPVMGTPDEALSTPVAVLRFLHALADARSALPGVAFVFGDARSAGGTVRALVRQPLALPTVRGLLPSQREAVARDWRSGYNRLLRERDGLRQLAFRPRVRRRAGAGVLRLVRHTPELLLVALAVGVLVVTWFRRNG